MSDAPENEEDGFDELEFVPNFIPLPAEFHSFTEEGPFTKCTLCEEPLLEDGTPYLIHKAFHRSEVIFEYAMCLPCRAKMQEELSTESLERINQYMDQFHIEDRNEQLLGQVTAAS